MSGARREPHLEARGHRTFHAVPHRKYRLQIVEVRGPANGPLALLANPQGLWGSSRRAHNTRHRSGRAPRPLPRSSITTPPRWRSTGSTSTASASRTPPSSRVAGTCNPRSRDTCGSSLAMALISAWRLHPRAMALSVAFRRPLSARGLRELRRVRRRRAVHGARSASRPTGWKAQPCNMHLSVREQRARVADRVHSRLDLSGCHRVDQDT